MQCGLYRAISDGKLRRHALLPGKSARRRHGIVRGRSGPRPDEERQLLQSAGIGAADLGPHRPRFFGRRVSETFLLAPHTGNEEEVRRSVRSLVDELVAESLIVPATDAPLNASSEPLGTAGPEAPFVLPVLERYTDMQELLLLDPYPRCGRIGLAAPQSRG